jgi:hypothetical protein
MDTMLKGVISNAKDGNLKAAVNEAKEILPKLNDGQEIKYCNAFIERFTIETKSLKFKDDIVVDKVLGIFEEYWRNVMLSDNESEYIERNLIQKIRNSFNECVDAIDDDSVFSRLSELLESKGYYSLFGRVIPFSDVLIWKRQQNGKRQIKLIDSSVEINLNMNFDFISLGWSGFSTLNLLYTGGWATNGTINAVMPAWKGINEEYFNIRLIAHEAQHCSDYLNFPNMEPMDLEYRAKLTEIYYANKIKPDLIRIYKTEANNNVSSPHAKANYKLFEQLGKSIDIDKCIEENKYDELNEIIYNVFINDTNERKENRLTNAST